MTKYLDIFIRDGLADTNTLPRTGAGTTSPDIIPSGTMPSADPGTQYGGDNYAKALGAPIVYGQQNYIYVRGMNYGTALSIGTVSLYSAYQNQLSTPSAWTALSTAGGSTTAALGANAGDVAVISDPFVWTPALPSSGNPYVLIAVIATKTNPDPVPAYKKKPTPYTDWQPGLGGVSALRVAVPVPPKTPSAYAFSALVNVGNSAPATLNFNLAWTNGVVGDLISLNSDTPGTKGPIGFEDFSITVASQNTSSTADVPAQYSAVVQYLYKAKNTAKLPAPTLTLTVSIQTTSGGGGDDPFNPGGGGTVTLQQVAEYVLTPTLSPQ
jgi:hypothetical protein